MDKQIAEDNWLDPDEIESEGELGRIMLEGYEEWVAEEGIDAELDMVSTEEILSMPLLNGEVELQGKLDMRVKRKADGARLVRDFKTTANFTDIEATAQINEQVLTYLLLEGANKAPGERSDGAIFTMLKKVKRTASAKPPFYKQFEVTHNDFTLKSFWLSLHGVVTEMMNAKKALDAGVAHQQVAYPHPSRDCTWKCPFFTICPMANDGSGMEDAIKELYVVSDPYDYYANGKTTEKEDSN